MNGNERYILEGIIIVLIAAYIFYENVFMAVILSPYVYIHYRQRIKERIVHDKKMSQTTRIPLHPLKEIWERTDV